MFVNQFQVHGRATEFEQDFTEAGEFMAARPGFVQHTLSRGLGAGQAERYVNIALWCDEQSLRAAVAHPGFTAHAERIRARATSTSGLYVPCQTRPA